jgi:hypothetical protein
MPAAQQMQRCVVFVLAFPLAEINLDPGVNDTVQHSTQVIISSVRPAPIGGLEQ